MVVDALLCVRLLSRGRWQVEDVAAQLGVTRRTVYRLLDALERADLPVRRDKEGRCVYLRVRREDVEAWLYPPQPIGRPSTDPPRACVIPGCALRRLGRDLCAGHESRLRRTGASLATDWRSDARLVALLARPLRDATVRLTCAADDCARPAHARGLCRLHYQQRRTTERLATHGRPTCEASECDRAAAAWGLCATHYGRARRAGLDATWRTSPAAVAIVSSPVRRYPTRVARRPST